jgi:hypothetical protein
MGRGESDFDTTTSRRRLETAEEIDKRSATAAWDELDRALADRPFRRLEGLGKSTSPVILIVCVLFLIIVVAGILLV